MMNWRTIESAPKDGTKIFLGYSSNTHEGNCFYEGDCSWQRGEWRQWAIDGFETMGWVLVEFTPNCWHPMPEDPPIQKELKSYEKEHSDDHPDSCVCSVCMTRNTCPNPENDEEV